MGMGVVSAYLAALQRFIKPAQLRRDARLFRGHGDSDWSLAPSSERGGAKRAITSYNALGEWILAASPFAVPRPQNQTEWLALAQHYGIATPLLDWTYNPLAALFFACEAAGDKSGCVLMLDTDNLKIAADAMMVDPFATQRLSGLLIPMTGLVARTNSQFSAMTLSPIVQGIVRNDMLTTREVFRVQSDEKNSTLAALGVLGMTPRHVFADVEHAAQDYLS